MKKYLSLICIICIAFSNVSIVDAVTYPATTPTGEQAGGWFNTYFTNMFATAGISDTTPNYTIGCNVGEVMRGFSNTGRVLCIPPGLGSTSSATLSLSGDLIGVPNYVAKYTPTGTGINISQIYDNGTNIGIATITPTAKLDINGTIRIGGGTPAVGRVLTSDATGLASWGLPPAPCIAGGSGVNNTCYGINSLQMNTTGFQNTSVGNSVLLFNNSGWGNSALGYQSLLQNTTGFANTAVGNEALNANISGIGNTANGYSSLRQNAIGNYNTTLGYLGLYNVTGNSNTALGENAGYNITSGSNNTTIGADTDVINPTGSNQLNISNLIFGTNLNGSVGAPAGNIGIGIANPTARLEVAGQIKITGGAPGIGKTLMSDATGLATWTDTVSGSTATGIVSGSGSANYLPKFGSGGIGIYPSQLLDNGTNVGIGTATPTSKLEVNGDIAFTANAQYISMKNSLSLPTRVFGINAVNDLYIGGIDNNIANILFITSTGLERMRLDNAGNLGIGTTVPGAKLEVNGQVKITGGSPGLNKVLASDATGLASWVSLAAVSGAWSTLGNIGTIAGTNFLGTTDNVDLVFKTNNTENMRIQTTGNVGIGTATPGARLDVNGQIRITGGSPGLNKVLVSDASGLATWATPPTPCISTGTGVDNRCYDLSNLQFNTSGMGNSVYGHFGLNSNTTGSDNTAIGAYALMYNTSGYRNTAIGRETLNNNTTGYNNTALGFAALATVTTGTNNTAIGYATALGISTGSANTIIGANVSGLATGLSNNIIIADGSGNQRINVTSTGNVGIGTASPVTKLDVAGQVRITGGSPGVGKMLVSDATGLASWTGIVTATGINISGATLGSTLYYNGTSWVAGTGLYNTGSNIGIGTAAPTSKFTLDSGVNNVSGLKFNRISSSSTTYSGATVGLGVDGSGNLVPISNGDVVVYEAQGRNSTQPVPDPNIADREISYNFNNYFAIPTKQSFVVSDGNGAGYNAPYFKENGVSGLCSGGGSPYDCANADPVTGLSASPNNSFTMTAKGSTYGYQIALGARGDAPLFARSGRFTGSQTNGLFLSDGTTPTPWQKVLTVPANHLEYFYVNIGYNSQLQAISGGGNVGIGTSFPDRRLVIASSGSTTSDDPQLQIRRGFQGADASLGNVFGTPYVNIGGLENRVGAIQSIGFGYNSLSGTVRYAPAEIGFLTTSTTGNTQGAIVFANRNGTTNVAPTEVMRIASNGSVGIGTNNPTSKLEIDSGITDRSGLKFTRLNNSAVLVSTGVTAIGVNGSGEVVAISPISNIAVYEGRPRDDVSVNPDPNTAALQIRYNFNNYFAIPGKQSFVVSKGDSVAYNGPYVKENGVSGLCSGGGSPYDCANPDPVTGLSASPQNSFTMSAKSETVGYQIALSARGDAPLFARSGFFSGSNNTGGLYLANLTTPTPWQKVLSIPANHPEYLFVNNGYNSQLQAISGGGNVGVGTTFPDSRFEIWTGASTAPLMHFRGTRNIALGLDALDVTATGTITSSNNTAIGYNAGSNLTTGSNNIMLGADARAQSAASNGTMNIGNTIFATNLPAAFGGIAGNIGIGVANPTQQLDISRSINIPATTGAFTGVIYSNGNRLIHNYSRTQFPSSNLFIGLGAGNFTMGTGAGADPVYYGTENLGIGSNSLDANTTGYSNTAIGLNSLTNNTTGFSNMALGYATLASNTVGSSNTAVGRSALTLNTTASNNTAIGFQSLQSNTTGNNNTSIGYSALQSNQGGTANTSVGYQSLLANTTGQFNTSLGYQSLHKNIASQSNTSVGYQALFNNVSGGNNTSLGVLAGGNITSGSSNIVIGYNAQVASATASNQLSIGNWIYGSGGNIGIGISNPTAKLEVTGQIKITGGVPGNGKVLTSDATGLASWQTPSGAAAIPWAIAGNAGTIPTTNFVGTTDAQALAFRTNNVERMRMTSTGSLGIGTTNPSYRVDVNGDLIASGWLRTRTTNGWYSETYGGGIWMNDSTWVRIYNNKSLWTDAVIHSSSGVTVGYAGTIPPVGGAIFSGNVGVGTNAPAARLDVNGTIRIAGGSPGNGKVLVSDASGIASWQALAGSSGALGNWSIVGNTGMVATTNFVGTIDSNPLVFRTNNTERLRINATDGNLSINGMILGRGNASILGNTVLGVTALNGNTTGANSTAIGYQALQISTTGSGNTAIGYNAGNAITTGSNNIAIGNSAQVRTATASNQLSIGNWIYGNGGNIGIGTNNPLARLDINGQIRITGGVPGLNKVLISDATGLASWSNIPTSLSEWSKTGNSILGTDFLGSTNAQDLVFRTNNIERVRILQNGNVSLNSLILGRGGNGTQVSTTALGVSALLLNTTGVSNTAMGNSALASVISGGFNTAMGHGALFANTATNNTAIGYNAGNAITTGSNNIAIGYNAQVRTATASNQLSIGNWIYGNGGNIGIGTNNPGQKLTISGGTIQIIDGTQGVGKYLKSDANGVASWQSPTAGTGTYIYRMAAGDNTSSATLGTVTALTTTPLPVGPYTFELIGKFQSAATANGIGMTLANISAASTDFIGTVSSQLDASSMFDGSFVTAGSPVISTDVPTANTDFAIFMKGTFRVTSTGTVAVQYRSENGGTQVRLQPGTVLIIKSLDPALAGGGI